MYCYLSQLSAREQGKRVIKMILILLPLLPSKYYCVSPRLLTLCSSRVALLEHFALMKRCHVSSDHDGLKDYNLLRDLWHRSAWGEIAASPRRQVASLPEKGPRDMIDATEPQPPGKAQSG